MRSDGCVVCWGNNDSKNPLDGAPTDAGYVDIKCGYHHTVALHTDGRIVTWGSNRHGQLNDSPSDTGYVAIACGEFHAVALHTDGHVVTWGSRRYGQRYRAPRNLRALPASR
mmetsp:Transcript_26676/g.106868  ORF Transcript_26676/g.106868 Transcript_26676/m.106868 type:complete len:112 (+) Transcript_26676:113-448(+)